MKQLNLSGDPEDLRRQLASLSRAERFEVLEEARAALAREDFVYYCKYVHGWDLEPHHLEWVRLLQENNRVCIVAPPESGKSRLMRAWMEWKIGRDPNIALLLIQNTGRQTGLQVSAIGNVLKDAKYRRVFPHIKETDRWSGDKIFIDRSGLKMEFRTDGTLSGYGIDGAYQGAHVDGEVIDDPTDQKDVYSTQVMQTQKDLMKGVLYDRLNEFDTDGNPTFLYIILTRWGDFDLLQTIEEDMRIPIFTFPVYRDEPYPWGSNYLCERQYGELRCKELELTKGPDLYKLSYLCTASGAIRGDRVFPGLHKLRHLKSFKEEGHPRYKAGAQGVDWGTTQTHQTALVAAQMSYDGIVTVRGAWMSPSGSSSELLDRMLDFKNDYKIHNAWIDRSQGSLRDQIKYQISMGCWWGERSVEQRIMTLRTLIDTGRIVFDKDGPGITALWDQLTSYAKDDGGRVIERNDDLVDALLYALAALFQPSRSGVGPMIEILPSKDEGPDMQDAYHDGFDPGNYKTDALGGVGREHKMGDYSNLV
jgi:hypothetical protein